MFCLMIRRPPRPTRTDTRLPYTTLFRSKPSDEAAGGPAPRTRGGGGMVDDLTRTAASLKLDANQQAAFDAAVETIRQRQAARQAAPQQRSEERRVGKECGSTCRSRGSTYH